MPRDRPLPRNGHHGNGKVYTSRGCVSFLLWQKKKKWSAMSSEETIFALRGSCQSCRGRTRAPLRITPAREEQERRADRTRAPKQFPDGSRYTGKFFFPRAGCIFTPRPPPPGGARLGCRRYPSQCPAPGEKVRRLTALGRPRNVLAGKLIG